MPWLAEGKMTVNRTVGLARRGLRWNQAANLGSESVCSSIRVDVGRQDVFNLHRLAVVSFRPSSGLPKFRERALY